jgi:hypothetical protein
MLTIGAMELFTFEERSKKKGTKERKKKNQRENNKA